MTCAPHRFLANDRNVLRDAVLTPSTVLPVTDQVNALAIARKGTAQAILAGAYTGVEQKRIDIEIVDTIPADPIVSAPRFSGAGSSLLKDVSATGLPSQTITIQLIDAGQPATYASLSFEGQRLKARTIGAVGNNIAITIDQTGITVADEAVAALVEALDAGAGGPTNGIESTALDFGGTTAILGADGLIPANANRLVFGEDTSTIYTNYKAYVDNRWQFHFVPELKRNIPAGTPVYFVTGGRTVTISDGVTIETIPNVVTVYDLLNWIRNNSQLLEVDGVVANDRTPTGQAVRELAVRTDAHALPSLGSGGSATGFVDVFVNDNAQTDLIIATCYAAKLEDHPLARLGKTRWEVRSALRGRLGEAVEGEPFVDTTVPPRFGFTIPVKLPPGYGVQRGDFTWLEDRPVPRDDGELPMPNHCDKHMKLGSEAVSQQITLTWTNRPPKDCDCKSMIAPAIGGECLGIIDADSEAGMDLTAEARQRLKDLYDWGNTLSTAVASYIQGLEKDGIPETSVNVTAQKVTGAASFDHEDKFVHTLGPVGEGEEATADYTDNLNIPHDDALEPTTFADDAPAMIQSVIDVYENGILQINEVTDTALVAAGWAQFDLVLQQWIDDFTGTPSFMAYRLKNLTIEKYKVLVRQAMAYAGISLGKSDASADESGDGCWQDYGDPAYFRVEGSVRGGYAPLFVNKAYYSSRRASQEDRYFSTKEFGFALMIDPACIARLKEGDQIVYVIGDAGWPSTYQVGDQNTLPTVAAAALHPAGGRDDNSEQTWSVDGTVHGPFAPWQFTPGGAAAYSDDGLAFDLTQRGIPNQKGDTWTLSISGGHARSRVDGGSWSAPFGIVSGASAFMDGLTLEWRPGMDPPFVVGDTYSFDALQPWAVSHVRTGKPDRWRWALESPDVAMLDIDPGEEVELDGFALWHTIPEGATITLRGGSTTGVADWAETITWRPFLTVEPFMVNRTARYLRLDVADGYGGSVFWQWGGIMLANTYPIDVNPKPRVRASRGSSPLAQGGAKLASARGATVDFQRFGVLQADMEAILAMWEWTKGSRGDAEIEPIIVVPNVLRPEDAIIGEIDQDELVFDEMTGQQATDGDLRRYSGNFSVSGIWRPRA